MTKRALFLHGTGGTPDDHWWPWLRGRFEESGYEVWAPLLPGSTRPSAVKYWGSLHSSDWDFTDNVPVGHSSGATSVLNLLATSKFPEVKAVVLVGVFLNENLTKGSPDFEDNDQFADLFPAEGYDWSAIKTKAEKLYFVHGDDDPYCAYEDAVAAAEMLGGEVITIPGGGHLSGDSGITELPQLIDVLKRGSLL